LLRNTVAPKRKRHRLNMTIYESLSYFNKVMANLIVSNYPYFLGLPVGSLDGHGGQTIYDFNGL
jgi:hypothetical protein